MPDKGRSSLLSLAGDGKKAAAFVVAVHATAVAIGGRALLICGPSRSGKSRLACALIAASTRRRPIRLIGDDRILLKSSASGIVARPHPRIAGFIERRGLGLVAMPHQEAATLAAVVTLDGSATLKTILGANFPVLPLVDSPETNRRDAVLLWWDDAWSATSASQSAEKAVPRPGLRRKD